MRSNDRETHPTDPMAALTRIRASASILACLVLPACGTDVEWLLERDSILVARADKVAASAEAIEPDSTTPMYDAEDAKRAACESIYGSISELMTRPPSFGEELAADVGAFVAYLFPIEEVERCADAQAKYESAVGALERGVGAPDATPAGAEAGED
ncbi:MAG: hypothetical protein ACREEV_12445 [Dongiaceae bacterium]